MMKLFRPIIRVLHMMDADGKVRGIYYRVLSAQLKAGLTLEKAVRNTAEVMPENSLAKVFGKRLEVLRGSGKLVTQDWLESDWLPIIDAQMLNVAERRNTLPDALGELASRQSNPTGLFALVIKPNLYYMVALSMSLVFMWWFKDFLEMLAGRYPQVLEGQLAYALSIWLRSVGPYILVAFFSLLLFYMFCCRYVTGTTRKYLRWLTFDYDNQFAIQFLYMSRVFSQQGASFSETVDMSASTLSGRHIQRSFKDVKSALARGADYMVVIRDVLVPSGIAGILSGMAPANDRQKLPLAYKTAESILREKMVGSYGKVAMLLRLIILITTLAVISQLVFGMYGTTSDMTDAVMVNKSSM